MPFKLLATATLPLDPQLQWLWYSTQSAGFITGDQRAAFAIPTSNPRAPAPLNPARPHDASASQHHPCNLPIPASLYDEFASAPWHGFQFLESFAYDRAVGAAEHPLGDLLRILVFGPDYAHYLRHPASGMILSLKSGSMNLLEQTPDGFKSLDQTKTRGRAALAFAAHPSESLLAYGDNYGTFHAHRFDQSAFGKAAKIAAKDRKASRLDFINGGKTLLIGGMGYLATFSYVAGKFTLAHELAIPVRDFISPDDGQLIFVNQGLHGVTAYRNTPTGFTKLADLQPDAAVQQIALSHCRRYLALTFQQSPNVSIYSISLE
jgi:hypothetical protein